MTVAPFLLAAATAFALSSPDFAPHATLPKATMARECGGENRVPALSWTGVPPATKSFALVMHDPDAPIAGGFDHWVLYDVPARARALGVALPKGTRIGINTPGEAAYYGPCPPAGPAHHYVFTLYALDLNSIDSKRAVSGAALSKRIEGHVLGRATLIGVAAHP